MRELTELEQLSAVMYATLRKAGTHMANQPVIHVLANGFERFLRVAGHGEIVEQIDTKVDEFVHAACMTDTQDIVDWLRSTAIVREHGAIGGIR